MPEVVVFGSIALDSVETPFGKKENALGGSASYAAVASSIFSETGIAGIAGKDFPQEHLDFLESKGIDLEGVEKGAGKSFSWKGKYGFDVNVAETLEVDVSIHSGFNPRLPEKYRSVDFLFLGNMSPRHQLAVLEQMKKRPRLVISDTMNYYIEREKEKVLEVVKKSDIALMNDAEARQLFKTPNIIKAGKKILELDSEIAIIKKGENGSVLITKNSFFSIPGYPLEDVVDPTGCGDCFAGSLIGFLAKTKDLGEKNLRKAVVTASAVASFNAEAFSLDNLKRINAEDINKRISEFKQFVEF